MLMMGVDMNTDISKPMAVFFMELCMGETSGHMANIPNNPTLYGLCKAHGIVTELDFAHFLELIAAKLKSDKDIF